MSRARVKITIPPFELGWSARYGYSAQRIVRKFSGGALFQKTVLTALKETTLVLTHNEFRAFLKEIEPFFPKDQYFKWSVEEIEVEFTPSAPPREGASTVKGTHCEKETKPLYTFRIPAEAIHKANHHQDMYRGLIGRYFKLSFGRCKWMQDQILICTADQYMNFVFAVKNALWQTSTEVPDWVHKFDLYTGVNKDPVVYDVYQNKTKKWKNPSSGVEFVKIHFDKLHTCNPEIREQIDKCFDLVIYDNDRAKDDGCVIVARSSQFAGFTVAMTYAQYDIKDYHPELVNAKEYIAQRDQDEFDKGWYTDVSSDDAREFYCD